MKQYENIEEKLCQELEKLDKKYASGTDMTMQDLEMIRMIYSSLAKSHMYFEMKEESEMDEDMEGSGTRGGRSYYGRSYRRGRDSMGRYVSRDMDPGYSGHYPEWLPPYGRY